MNCVALLLCVSVLIVVVHADVYMHHPRGSNNKLSEQSNNVNNANRLFDSQNNGNGGYHVCDNCNGPCHKSNEDRSYDPTRPGAKKGEMYYYESSHLHVEWTQQHGCGKGNRNLKCDIVLQYACEDTMPMLGDGTVTTKPGGNQNQNNDLEDEKYQSYPSSKRVTDRYGQHESYDFYMRARGRKRNMGLYVANQLNPNDNNKKTAVFTRQRNNGGNNNNGRFGFEVPEERDYFPYWHWSPWRDLMVQTTETTRCPYYQEESQNVAPKGECVTEPPYLCENYEHCRKQRYNNGNNNGNNNAATDYQFPNNPKECADFPKVESTIEKAKWVQKESYGISPLDIEGNHLKCMTSQNGRTNHLGNTDSGYAPHYDLIIPNAALRNPYPYNGLSNEECESEETINLKIMDGDNEDTEITLMKDIKDCVSIEYIKQKLTSITSGYRYQYRLCKDVSCTNTPRGLGRTGTTKDKGSRGTLKDFDITSNTPLYLFKSKFEDGLKCVLRIRYNISSGDFDGWNTFASDNQGGHIGSTGDPTKDFVGLGQLISGPLELSVNTAQFNRVFEDRSHVFRIKPWPSSTVQYGVSAIHNFNVRGRRGNIVQVYPAVEYDFVSSGLEGSSTSVSQFDHLHIQWCGSDANPQGNAGNGRQATDRHNLVQMSTRSQNKPMDMTYTCKDTIGGCGSGDVDHLWNYETSMFPSKEVTARLAWVDQSIDGKNFTCDLDTDDENDITNCMYLNNAPAYFDAGLVRLNNVGEFHLMGTRNNAFTNRGQKTTMTVGLNSVVAVGVTVLSVSVLGLVALGSFISCFLPKYAYHNKKSCWSKTRCGKSAILKYEKQILDGNAIDHSNEKKQLKWSKKDEWWAYEGKRVRWVAALISVNILMATYGYFKASYEKPLLPRSYPLAKAGGAILNFNCATILIPVCRNMLSWLRTTPVSELLPLDDNIYFHKLCGLGIVFGAFLHISCHHWNFYNLMYNYQYGKYVMRVDDREKKCFNFYLVFIVKKLNFFIFAIFKFLGTTHETYVGMMFGSFANITGYAILGTMIPMYITALECVRRSHRGCCVCCCPCFRRWCCCCCKGTGYTLFFNVHKLWYIVIGLLWLHGKSFWIYSLWPLIFCLVEKFIQSRRGKQPVTIIEVVQHASDVIEIKMKLNSEKRLKYTAGQYLYLNVPVISEEEWHPFTLSSAPEEPYFSCHIRCRKDMDWTYALRTLLNPERKKTGTFKNYIVATRKEQNKYLKSLISDMGNTNTNKKNDKGSGETKNNGDLLENPMIDNSEGRLQPVIRVDGPYGSASEEGKNKNQNFLCFYIESTETVYFIFLIFF
jgi:hypothetical protein